MLTVGLAQGDTASLALFRIYINDLSRELRTSVGKYPEGTCPSEGDPCKLVADDVLLIATSQEELQTLLNVCASWATQNELEWKLAKCAVIAGECNEIQRPFTLSGQEVPVQKSVTYLGLTICTREFTKQLNEETKKNCSIAYSETAGHSFFETGLPNDTIRILFRMNIRIILLYGAMLVTNTQDLEEMETALLNQYLKKLLFLNRPLHKKLLHRLFNRLRIPSLSMKLEKSTRSWILKLRRYAHS